MKLNRYLIISKNGDSTYFYYILSAMVHYKNKILKKKKNKIGYKKRIIILGEYNS